MGIFANATVMAMIHFHQKDRTVAEKIIKIPFKPLTDFVGASDAKKKRIIKDQHKTNRFNFWYQTAKSAIPKYVTTGFDEDILVHAIEDLQRSNPLTNRQRTNRTNSIVALRSFISMQFPSRFSNIKCSFSRKNYPLEYILNNLTVRVSPDVVVRWEENGQKYIGGIKFHIAKGEELNEHKGNLKASLLCDFIDKQVATLDEIVNHEYCFCVDVIHGKIFSAPLNTESDLQKLREACLEITRLWNIA
jgi:hypothetical protein